MIHGEASTTAVAGETAAQKTSRKRQVKKEAAVRQQVQQLKSRFQKAGANVKHTRNLPLLVLTMSESC